MYLNEIHYKLSSYGTRYNLRWDKEARSFFVDADDKNAVAGTIDSRISWRRELSDVEVANSLHWKLLEFEHTPIVDIKKHKLYKYSKG